jgi:carbonic anhydrase
MRIIKKGWGGFSRNFFENQTRPEFNCLNATFTIRSIQTMIYEKLLQDNKAWADNMLVHDPEFFHRLMNVQTPEILWIGCSDSRVPPDQITQTKPGEIFIHRNVANLVVHTDLNLLSVLQYAVEVLKVNHIIICGHYGCGGVKAAMGRSSLGIINKWLRNIKDVYRFHHDELEAITDEDKRLNRLIELNIVEQVNNLAKTSIVQHAWKERQAPHLHGWVYSLADGIINPLFDIAPGTHLEHPIYEYDNL